MSTVTRAICFHHPLREAAAKCVACGRSYCRECVTPMDRRMFCASCYREVSVTKVKSKRDWFVLSVAMQLILGVLGLWFTAYLVGRTLFDLPSDFHQGTVWEKFGEE